MSAPTSAMMLDTEILLLWRSTPKKLRPCSHGASSGDFSPEETSTILSVFPRPPT